MKYLVIIIGILSIFGLAAFILHFTDKKENYANDVPNNTQYQKIKSFKLPRQPLVSALCVTIRRTKFLKHSIDDFLAQTYPNKELIIVYDDDDLETSGFAQEFVNQSNHPEVKFHKVPHKWNLGQIRNHSVQLANGEFVTQWDDDDRYDPMRIEIQLKASFMNKMNAILLKRWHIINTANNNKYMSQSRRPGWEGSILSPKKYLLKYKYGEGRKKGTQGEDSDCIDQLEDHRLISTIDVPDLYTYYLHDKNTITDETKNGHLHNATRL